MKIVDFIPNEPEELQRVRLISRRMNDLFESKHKTAVLVSWAEKIDKLGPSKQIREFRAIVEAAGSEKTPLRGMELKQVVKPLMHFFIGRAQPHTKRASEWQNLFKSVIDVVFKAKNATCRRDCFFLVAEKLVRLEGSAREDVLQYAIENAETTKVDQDRALRRTLTLMLDVVRIDSHSEDQWVTEAMRILAATGASGASIHGWGRHIVVEHVLDWLENIPSASRLDVMRSAIQIVMNDRRGQDRSVGLKRVLNKILSCAIDLMPDAFEHASYGVLNSSMSDQGKAECLEGIMKGVSRRARHLPLGTLENVLNMVSRFADPKAQLRAYACMRKDAEYYMDAHIFRMFLEHFQDFVMSKQEIPERTCLLIDILRDIGRLPSAICSAAYIRALDKLSKAELSDEERWKCELFIARRIHKDHSIDSSVAKVLLPRIAGMKDAKDELGAISYILGSKQVEFTDAGGEAALRRAQTLLAHAGAADAIRVEALSRMMKHFGKFPASAQESLFSHALNTVRSFEKDMDKARFVASLDGPAAVSPEYRDSALGFVHDISEQFSDENAFLAGVKNLAFWKEFEKNDEERVIAAAFKNIDRVKDDHTLVKLIQALIDDLFRNLTHPVPLKLSVKVLGRISCPEELKLARAHFPDIPMVRYMGGPEYGRDFEMLCMNRGL